MTRIDAIRGLTIQPVGSLLYLGAATMTPDEVEALKIVDASLERQGLGLSATPTHGMGVRLRIVRRLVADVVRG